MGALRGEAAVFVAWQRKALSESGSRRYSWELEFGEACACPPQGLGREKLTPVVRRAFRLGGKPRSEVVCRPACGIRRCCLENAADPLARVHFWREFDRKRDETLRTVDPDESPHLVAAYVGNGGWLWKELAKVVAKPTDDERALFDLFIWPGECFEPATMVEDRRRRLAEARVRLEAYKGTRRRGETPTQWLERRHAEERAAEERRRAEESAERRRRWVEWMMSPPGTPPPESFVPPDWQRLRDGWLEGEAAARRARADGNPWQWGRPSSAGPSVAAATLGVRWPCTPADLKSAFRRAALRTHPDQGGTAEAFRAAKAAHDEIAKALGL